MDPSQLPGMFTALEGNCRDAANPAAIAMAHQFERAVKKNLSLRSHPRFTETNAPAGSFPSQMFPPKIPPGLRASITSAGPTGGHAWVAPHVLYAGVQEYGRVITAHSIWSPMTFWNAYRGPAQWWSKYAVDVKKRPYMRPTVAQEVANGNLGRAAMSAFYIAMWG